MRDSRGSYDETANWHGNRRLRQRGETPDGETFRDFGVEDGF